MADWPAEGESPPFGGWRRSLGEWLVLLVSFVMYYCFHAIDMVLVDLIGIPSTFVSPTTLVGTDPAPPDARQSALTGAGTR